MSCERPATGVERCDGWSSRRLRKTTEAPRDRRGALVVSDDAPSTTLYLPEYQPPDADPVAGTARTMNRFGAGPTW
jgi:hypothetical protein